MGMVASKLLVLRATVDFGFKNYKVPVVDIWRSYQCCLAHLSLWEKASLFPCPCHYQKTCWLPGSWCRKLALRGKTPLGDLSTHQPSCFPRLQVPDSCNLDESYPKLRCSLFTVPFWLLQCSPQSLKSKSLTEELSWEFLTFFGKRESLRGRHVCCCPGPAPSLLHTLGLV